MKKMNYSIIINAPKEKVWHTMLEDKTYRIWTVVFSEGSHYLGNWQKGSKILFLGPDENGNKGGMVSCIKENRLYEYISIEHIGLIINGKEDLESEEVKKWAGAFENYTLKEKDGKTEILIDIDLNEDYIEMFNDMWPKALQKFKELSEM